MEFGVIKLVLWIKHNNPENTMQKKFEITCNGNAMLSENSFNDHLLPENNTETISRQTLSWLYIL